MTNEPFVFELPRTFVSAEEAQGVAAFAAAMLTALEQPGMPDAAAQGHFGVSESIGRWSVGITLPAGDHDPKNAVQIMLSVDHRISKSSHKRIVAAIATLAPVLHKWGAEDRQSLIIERPTPDNLVRAMLSKRKRDNRDPGAVFKPDDDVLRFNDWWNAVFCRPQGIAENPVSRSYARAPRPQKRAPKGTALALGDAPPREPVAGEYWRLVDPASASNAILSLVRHRDGGYPDDPVLLVSEVRYVGNAAHSVEVKAHPRSIFTAGTTFAVTEFRAVFAFAPDGLDVRTREQAQLDRELHDLSDQAQRGPSVDALLALPAGLESEFSTHDSEADGVDAVPGAALALPAPLATALPAPLARAAGRLEQARCDLVVARRRGLWYNAITATISRRTQELAAFHEERATAIVASLADVRSLVKGLAQGVTSLSLYSGEGVEVQALLDGSGAPADEPLYLMQSRLHLDEEYLTNLATGGADWDDWDDFVEALADDAALLHRLLPFPRCVALMRYRRTDKTYHTASKNATLFEIKGVAEANDEANEPNREAFLLIRNGAKLYRVFSPIGTSAAERLFPQSGELARPFRGYKGSELDFSDVTFFEAHEQSEKSALFYRRLLILMWGLHDRAGVFGEFYDRSRYGEIGFMDIRLQHDRFRFIADDDSAFALGDGTDTFAQWIGECNARIAPGSRILARWRSLMTAESCPSAFGRNRRTQDDYFHSAPKEDVGIGVVHVRNGNLCVDVECVPRYGRGPARVLHINLAAAPALFDRELRALVLDSVRIEDLDRHLRSRVARRGYLAFAELFIEARKTLIAEEAQLAPFELTVAGDLVSSNLATDDASATRIAREAVRLWRLGHKGELPQADALEAVRSIAYSVLDDSLDVDGIARTTAAAGCVPIAVLKNADGKLLLVRSIAEDEYLGWALPEPWLARVRIDFAKGTWREGAAHFVLPNQAAVGHRVLHRWVTADAKAADERLTVATPRSQYARWTKRLASPDVLRATDLLLGKPEAIADALGTNPIAFLSSLTRRLKVRDQIVRPRCWAPLGIVRAVSPDREQRAQPLGEFRILVAFRELWSIVLDGATPEDRAEAHAFWDRYARSSTHQLERIAQSSLTLATLNFEAKVPSFDGLLTVLPYDFVSHSGLAVKPADPIGNVVDGLLSGDLTFGSHSLVSLVSDSSNALLKECLATANRVASTENIRIPDYKRLQ